MRSDLRPECSERLAGGGAYCGGPLHAAQLVFLHPNTDDELITSKNVRAELNSLTKLHYYAPAPNRREH